MKKIAFSFKLLLLTLIIGCITSCSNRKDLQYIVETTRALNEQQLVNRFLQVPADANEDVKKIIANIAKTEQATPFLANYAAKFGVPEWKYMFGDKNKLATPSQSNSSNYAALGSGNNSANNSNRGFYFIPLTDSVTKRTKAFIYCQQYNDTLFTYRTYDVDAILAANPTNDTAKQNKEIALGFAGYFERKINGSVQTDAFKNNKFSKVNIRINDSVKSITNNSDRQTLIDPGVCTKKVLITIEHEVRDGYFEYEVIAVKIPCDGGSGGGGQPVATLPPPNLGGGGIINPPPPPPSNLPPAITNPPSTTPPPYVSNPPSTTPPPSVSNPPNYGSYPGYTPPSGGGGGSYNGSNPGSGYQYGPYLPPYYWDIGNPCDPGTYPWDNVYPRQPFVPIYNDYAVEPFIWNFISDDGTTFLDNNPFNEPDFQFDPKDNYESLYPNFTNVVKNLKSFVKNNPNVLNALQTWSGFSKQQVLDKLTFGKGPTIKIEEMEGRFAFYNKDKGISTLHIRGSYVRGLEQSVLPSTKQATAFLLAVSILHEFVHLGTTKNNISEGKYDFGLGFEQDGFNVIVDDDNAGKVVIKFSRYF